MYEGRSLYIDCNASTFLFLLGLRQHQLNII